MFQHVLVRTTPCTGVYEGSCKYFYERLGSSYWIQQLRRPHNALGLCKTMRYPNLPNLGPELEKTTYTLSSSCAIWSRLYWWATKMQPCNLSTGQLVSIDLCRAAPGRRHLNCRPARPSGGRVPSWWPRSPSPSAPPAPTSRPPSSSRSRASPWLLRTRLRTLCGTMVRYSRDPQNDVKCTLRCNVGCFVIVGVIVLLSVSLAWWPLALIVSVICMVAAASWLPHRRGCGSVTHALRHRCRGVWSSRLALFALWFRASATEATHGTCGQPIFCRDVGG